VNCGKIGKYFCAQCISGINFIEANESICPMCEKPAIGGYTHPRCQTKYSIDGLTSFFHYSGPVKKAIKAIKYRWVFDLALEFTSLIPSDVNFPSMVYNRRSVLIPIPLHPIRYRSRGFNQAEVLGQYIAKRLHCAMQVGILARTKFRVPQVIMVHRKERLKNMEGVFDYIATKDGKTHGPVILFDDVFTTGATMRAAANVLKRHGAQFVWALTMAR
jgi:ComF family protein